MQPTLYAFTLAFYAKNTDTLKYELMLLLPIFSFKSIITIFILFLFGSFISRLFKNKILLLGNTKTKTERSLKQYGLENGFLCYTALKFVTTKKSMKNLNQNDGLGWDLNRTLFKQRNSGVFRILDNKL
jgi:hypothetical protein